MGDDEDGAALHQGVHTLGDEGLGPGVDGGGGLVQDHDRGIGHRRPGNGQQLPLTLAQVAAVAGDKGIVPVGQAADEGVGVGDLGGLDALLVGGVQPAVADVVHDGAGEEVGVLEHRAQGVAEIVLPDGLDVDAVKGDHAALDLVKAVDEVGDGGLARAGGAHKGDLLAGIGVDVDLFQDALSGHIGEVHIGEADRALELGEVVVLAGHIAHRAPDEMEGGLSVGIGVFPGPAVGGEQGQVRDGGKGPVGLHPDPEVLLRILMRGQELEPLPRPDSLPQLDESVPLPQYGDQGHGGGAGGLPGPGVGPAGAGVGREGAVGVLLGRDQGDHALVLLGLGVHGVKDALGARQGG